MNESRLKHAASWRDVDAREVQKPVGQARVHVGDKRASARLDQIVSWSRELQEREARRAWARSAGMAAEPWGALGAWRRQTAASFWDPPYSKWCGLAVEHHPGNCGHQPPSTPRFREERRQTRHPIIQIQC